MMMSATARQHITDKAYFFDFALGMPAVRASIEIGLFSISFMSFSASHAS